jgi:uncharacterized protein YigE (DUF2233 family)
MRRATRAGLALILTLWGASPALAACRDDMFEGMPFAVCEVVAGADLRLFQTGPEGRPFSSFAAVDAALRAQGQRLAFAMNGGMYHPDRRPVGLLIVDGTEVAPIVTAEGPGNFGLLPNGVFCIEEDRFRVIESRAFAADTPACRHATQSGPMLVIGGALHPRFLQGSDSLNIRNGVGVSPDGHRAFLVISGARVNFHLFARYFRDHLGVADALYLDGQISRLYAPDLPRDDPGWPMGPIIGLVAPGG